MSPLRLVAAGALVATGLALSACVEGGYGSGGVAVGYSDWDPYYGGFHADPYWGWNGDYYYPGTGLYVYDRSNHRTRWNDAQRGYWQGRGQAWRGRQTRPMWRDYGVTGTPGRGMGHRGRH